MSGEIVQAQRGAAISEWSEGFQKLVTETILRPSKRSATAAELALLAEQAIRTGLDPMSRQIYGIYRWNKRTRDEEMTIQVGIDGLRIIAERTGKYVGQDGPFWRDDETDWTDVWFKSTPPTAAKVIVRKAAGGQVAETPAVAMRSEYMPTTKDGLPSGLWRDKPALMLAKCAEALALRKAFPQDMSGLYTDDEMARADGATAEPARQAELPATPAAEIEEVDAVELVSGKQAANLLTGAQMLAERGVRCGTMLVSLGAEQGPTLAETIRTLPADQADRFAEWMHARLDELDAEPPMTGAEAVAEGAA